MVKKRCTFKNLEENLKKPGRNSENLEKISKNLLATLFNITNSKKKTIHYFSLRVFIALYVKELMNFFVVKTYKMLFDTLVWCLKLE